MITYALHTDKVSLGESQDTNELECQGYHRQDNTPWWVALGPTSKAIVACSEATDGVITRVVRHEHSIVPNGGSIRCWF